jgi:hypothetical protein
MRLGCLAEHANTYMHAVLNSMPSSHDEIRVST